MVTSFNLKPSFMNKPETATAADSVPASKPRRRRRSLLMLLRRIHLYAGLFLLPWVFLYGITGAMYNHVGLFPEVDIQNVPASQLKDSALADFPTPEALAEAVVARLRESAPGVTIELLGEQDPEFVNDVILRVNDGETKRTVHIDPIQKSAWIASSEDSKGPQTLLKDVRNVSLESNPHQLAAQAVPDILKAAGLNSDLNAQLAGWSKLNFLASVDGQTARITYVLRDGHVDVTQYDGDPGMSIRRFFMRLHTTHGRSPHWNGRMLWSVVIDVMAIAMVTWGITGIVMWWQIKRTRIIGMCVIGLSIVSAFAAYYSVAHFYATSKL